MDKSILEQLQDNAPHFTSLAIRYQNLSVADLQLLVAALKNNTFLTELDLTGNPLGDEGALIVSKLANVKSLNLTGTQISGKGARALAHNSQLRSLNLSQNKIDSKGAEAFSHNKGLFHLNLAGNRIDDDGVVQLVNNSTLKELNLADNQVNKRACFALSHNKNLTYLNMSNTLLDDDDAIVLARHENLKSIILDYNNLGTDTAEAFAANKKLLFLSFNYNKLGIEGVNALAKNTTLKTLYLAGNKIDDTGVEALAQNETLMSLDLQYNQIANQGAAFLKCNKHLIELDISYNQLSREGAKSLAEHPTLRKLAINHNLLGDEGALILAQSQHIDWLSITANQLTAAGAQALAHNTHLKTLMISINSIGDVGAAALADSTSLSTLFASHNQITDVGAMAFLQNQTLDTLNLNYNYISDSTKETLEQKKSLKSLQIATKKPQQFALENYNDILLLSQDFLCILDFNYRIQFFNPSLPRILGVIDDDLIAISYFDLLHSEDRQLAKSQIEAISSNFPLQWVHRCQVKSGAFCWIQWNLRRREEGIYLIGADITMKKKAEAKLNRLERQRDLALLEVQQKEYYSRKQAEFIAYLCHELRNPLSGTYSNLEALKEYIDKRQELEEQPITFAVKQEIKEIYTKIQESLSDMETCITQQEAILNDNLDAVKILENKLQLEDNVLNLNETMRAASKMFKQKAEKKGLAFNLHLPAEEVWVKGDEARKRQILINLLSNAVKFTNEGQIDIRLEVQERTAEYTKFKIIIRDTGIGLDAEEINKLFERFSQVNASVGNKYGGSGLGLFIAKKLAQSMEGDIHVESQKGMGSSFYCTFQCQSATAPIMTVKKETVIETPAIAPLALPPKQGKILVVEDNEINQRVLGANLEKAGYECIFASDGKEGIEKFLSRSPNLILMDIIMPKMDGISTTQKIRHYESEHQLTPVPIIALSGNALPQQKQQALDAGMDDYIVKPYKREQILDKVSVWLVPNRDTLGEQVSFEQNCSHR